MSYTFGDNHEASRRLGRHMLQLCDGYQLRWSNLSGFDNLLEQPFGGVKELSVGILELILIMHSFLCSSDLRCIAPNPQCTAMIRRPANHFSHFSSPS